MLHLARALTLLVTIVTMPSAFAATTAAPASRSTSGSKTQALNIPGNPYTELTGGTTNFTQTLDNTHVEHPFGFHASVQSRFAMFHFGVGMLGAIHDEEQQSGTYNQVNINESCYLETLNVGLILNEFLVLDGGYGLAQMRRSVSNPYATPNSTTVNTTASGTGWTLGATVVPIRTKATSVGLSYYYFDATANSYSQDNVGTTATTTSAPAKVHSFGSLAGITFLLNY